MGRMTRPKSRESGYTGGKHSYACSSSSWPERSIPIFSLRIRERARFPWTGLGTKDVAYYLHIRVFPIFSPSSRSFFTLCMSIFFPCSVCHWLTRGPYASDIHYIMPGILNTFFSLLHPFLITYFFLGLIFYVFLNGIFGPGFAGCQSRGLWSGLTGRISVYHPFSCDPGIWPPNSRQISGENDTSESDGSACVFQRILTIGLTGLFSSWNIFLSFPVTKSRNRTRHVFQTEAFPFFPSSYCITLLILYSSTFHLIFEAQLTNWMN